MNYKLPRSRPAFTLVEFLLFVVILGVVGTVVLQILFAVFDFRMRQEAIAGLELRGGQIMLGITRRMRRAEAVLDPASGMSGSILALQMGSNSEFPTIYAMSGTGNLLIGEKNVVSGLLQPGLTIANLAFKNVNGTNVSVGFDLIGQFSLQGMPTYRQHFEATVTLLPDDVSDAGGCGSCPLPACTSGTYSWQYCSAGACTLSSSTLPC